MYLVCSESIISLFIFHFQFIPIIYSFSFSFFFLLFLFSFLFSCLISQANATQNSKRESFPPFSISLTFSLLNFIDLRQTTYFYNNSLPSAKESKILLNKTSNLCSNSFNYVTITGMFYRSTFRSIQILVFISNEK